jgi:hypothetical protein
MLKSHGQFLAVMSSEFLIEISGYLPKAPSSGLIKVAANAFLATTITRKVNIVRDHVLAAAASWPGHRGPRRGGSSPATAVPSRQTIDIDRHRKSARQSRYRRCEPLSRYDIASWAINGSQRMIPILSGPSLCFMRRNWGEAVGFLKVFCHGYALESYRIHAGASEVCVVDIGVVE